MSELCHIRSDHQATMKPLHVSLSVSNGVRRGSGTKLIGPVPPGDCRISLTLLPGVGQEGTAPTGRCPWHLPGTSCPPAGTAAPPALCTAAAPAGVRRNTPLCLRSLLPFRKTARQECLCLDISHSLRKPPLRFFTFSFLCSHNPDKWELGQGWM